MSIHYLLDGYNILPQMKVPASADFEGERRHLLKFIEQVRPQGSANNPVTVVFDGKSGVVGREPASSVRVVFSWDVSADDEIRRIVAASKNAKNFVVVTDDRDIRYAVRALGARVLSVRAFLDRDRQGTPGRRDKNISHVDATRINEEVGNIWLKKDKRRRK